MRCIDETIIFAQERWNKIKTRDKEWTKTDALIYALELMDDNGILFDPTQSEWDYMLTQII